MGPCVVCPITLMGPEHVLPVAWESASESDVYWLVVSTNVYITFLCISGQLIMLYTFLEAATINQKLVLDRVSLTPFVIPKLQVPKLMWCRFTGWKLCDYYSCAKGWVHLDLRWLSARVSHPGWVGVETLRWTQPLLVEHQFPPYGNGNDHSIASKRAATPEFLWFLPGTDFQG
jgi:hypothetical protein